MYFVEPDANDEENYTCSEFRIDTTDPEDFICGNLQQFVPKFIQYQQTFHQTFIVMLFFLPGEHHLTQQLTVNNALMFSLYGQTGSIGGGKGGARGLKAPLGLLRGGLAPPQNDITPKLSFLKWG